jgi:predicted kinase
MSEVVQLVLMVGAPGAGKRERARQIAADSPGMVRVSRDDLRSMLTGRGYHRDTEPLIADAQAALLSALLGRGTSVVVDNCHVMPRSRSQVYASARAAPLDVGVTHEIVATPEPVCLKRNAARPPELRAPAQLVSRMALEITVSQAMAGASWLPDLVL